VSDQRLRRVACGLALLGAAVAGYLVYVHYADIKPICTIAHGCEKVQGSSYSRLAGIPVALLGLIGYVVIFMASLVRDERAVLLAATTAVVGAGFSAWLTYVELARLHAVCSWCVLSAVTMTLLAGVTVLRVLRSS
jgi:Predicted membrane protein